VRCASTLDGGESARCQLFVGHEGEHATAISASGVRLLATWTGRRRELHTFEAALAAGRPWAPGFPAAEPTPIGPPLRRSRPVDEQLAPSARDEAGETVEGSAA